MPIYPGTGTAESLVNNEPLREAYSNLPKIKFFVNKVVSRRGIKAAALDATDLAT
jgi:hypothetical protein